MRLCFYLQWQPLCHLKAKAYFLSLDFTEDSQEALVDIINRETCQGEHTDEFKWCNTIEVVDLQLTMVDKSPQGEQVSL